MKNGKMKVLVVDDYRPVAESIARCLKLAGYDVEIAESAPDALEQLRGGYRPQFVVTDFDMPGLPELSNGLQLAKAIHHFRPNVDVSMVTSHDVEPTSDITALFRKQEPGCEGRILEHLKGMAA